VRLARRVQERRGSGKSILACAEGGLDGRWMDDDEELNMVCRNNGPYRLINHNWTTMHDSAAHCIIVHYVLPHYNVLHDILRPSIHI
jgi:hypothetical protein